MSPRPRPRRPRRQARRRATAPAQRDGPAGRAGRADLARPTLAAPMRRYLEQIACVLRPGSVAQHRPGAALVRRVPARAARPRSPADRQVTRRHIEDYKPWLAARPGQHRPRASTATLAHRLGTLRMFFVRIEEWGWDEAPPKVPMFPGDLPRQDHPLPKALDDAAAAQLLRAAHNDQRGCSCGSPSRSCCAPGCGSASSPRCAPTPSS